MFEVRGALLVATGRHRPQAADLEVRRGGEESKLARCVAGRPEIEGAFLASSVLHRCRFVVHAGRRVEDVCFLQVTDHEVGGERGDGDQSPWSYGAAGSVGKPNPPWHSETAASKAPPRTGRARASPCANVAPAGASAAARM